MIGTVPRSNPIEATNLELWGTYNVLRSSSLNVLYFGALAARWSKLNFWLQVGAAVGSLSAITGFLTSQTSIAGSNEFWWRVGSAILGTVSGLCAALPSMMGLSDKISKGERLHFAYCELFHLAQRAAMDVRREGQITPEQMGVTKLLGDIYSRLGQFDDPGLDRKLRAKCEAEVRAKYSKDSLWYAIEDGNQGSQSKTPIPTAGKG